MKVAVVGAGSWGTAVASIACRNGDAVLWARRTELAREVVEQHRNTQYLPGVDLPVGLHATDSIEEAVTGADVVVMGVPSHGFRAILHQAAPHVASDVPIVSLAKGLEQQTAKRMTEVIDEVLPGRPAGVLTGPNLAREVLAGYPAASVVALAHDSVCEGLQLAFSTDAFRVYRNTDVVGCEMAGATKNVIAIAAGMADGMGFGDNTRAALITRGLAELSRLGVALGGDPLTFSGLAGMGDLVATCTSKQSRNRHVGEQLGRGHPIDAINRKMRMVAEGVRTSGALVELARSHGIEMPIAEQVAAVVHEGKSARDVIPALMGRSVKAELHGLGR